jgi:hypothetical protein
MITDVSIHLDTRLADAPFLLWVVCPWFLPQRTWSPSRRDHIMMTPSSAQPELSYECQMSVNLPTWARGPFTKKAALQGALQQTLLDAVVCSDAHAHGGAHDVCAAGIVMSGLPRTLLVH